MIAMSHPSLSASSVYRDCVSSIVDAAARIRFSTIAPAVDAASAALATAGQADTLHQIAVATEVTYGGCRVTKKELAELYSSGLVGEESQARTHYDHIRNSSVLCPYCDDGVVSELDHALPKSRYPALAVTPLNLVPVCKDCNDTKKGLVPKSASERFMHPYFDNASSFKWLDATVDRAYGLAVKFSVTTVPGMPTALNERLAYHFKKLALGSRYSVRAATALAELRHDCETIRQRSGPTSLSQDLLQRAKSCEHRHLNCWRAAVYRALAGDHAYCAMGT